MNVESIVSDCSSPCRLCAQTDGGLIDIYSEEGSALDILDKIKQYVPIEISQTDELSTKCCTDCVSKILSWHKFILHIKETSIILKVKAEESRKLSKGGQEHGREIDGKTSFYSRIKIEEQEVDRNNHESTSFGENVYETESFSVNNEQAYEEIEIRNIKGDTTFYSILKVEDEPDEWKDDIKILEKDFHELTSLEQDRDVEELPLEEEIADDAEEIILVNPPRCKRKELIKEFFCETCGSSYVRKSDLQRHRRMKHSGIERENSSCYRTNNKDILDKCRIFENGKKLYECDFCKHRTNDSDTLVRHRSTHTGIKPYICHICGKGFRLNDYLNRHVRVAHEGLKKFECDICERKFGSKPARNEHMNTHTGNRPFSCKICHKTFRQRSALHGHKIFHFDNFKYECKLCDKKFRRSSELVTHNRLHTGEKPYPCEYCGREFRFSQSLNQHRKRHLRKIEESIGLETAKEDS